MLHLLPPFPTQSCRNLMVLQQTGTLLERALSLSPRNAEYVTELAYQTLLHGTVKEALQQYKKAFNLDETSVPALAGTQMHQCLVTVLS